MPFTYPIFGMVHATKPKTHNQITSHDQSVFHNQITPFGQIMSYQTIQPNGQIMSHQTIQPNISPATLSNMLPTMPPGFNPYIYPYNSFHYQIPQPQTITRYNISLNNFFYELDKIYDGKGIYTALEKSFEKQEIIVNGIKELTDNQLIELD
ncbi:15025_t:CDS:1, partial [Dentiscutata heterogama]